MNIENTEFYKQKMMPYIVHKLVRVIIENNGKIPKSFSRKQESGSIYWKILKGGRDEGWWTYVSNPYNGHLTDMGKELFDEIKEHMD